MAEIDEKQAFEWLSKQRIRRKFNKHVITLESLREEGDVTEKPLDAEHFYQLLLAIATDLNRSKELEEKRNT
ncbi:MAG: hypothetical protein ACLRZ6_00250 [Lachnospiraceae bacterium]